MDVREMINTRPKTAAVVAAVVVLLGIVFAFYQITGGDNAAAYAMPNLLWYSDDDGKTCFADNAQRIPPFDHNGNIACRAYVYSCDNGKTKFVAYLERYTPQGQAERKKQLEKDPNDPLGLEYSKRGLVEVKAARSGGDYWVDVMDPKATVIRTPQCPGGKSKNLELIPAE